MNGTTWPWNAKRIKTCTCLLIGAAMVMALGLAGCGGGGGGSSSGTPEVSSPATAGLALPTEISAISADNQKSSLAAGMAVQMRAMAAAVSDLPADSDYKQTVTARFVDEPTLEVFGIIETILKAVNQTHYAAAENVGAGPYKSMVAWYDEMGGQSVKELEEWITMSTVAEIDGETVNTVHIWVAEEDGVVKAELKIHQEPSQDANGNYLNYGIWTMTADFGAGDFFIGEADLDAEGMTILSVNMQESDDEMPAGMEMTMKGIVHKSATAGYGLIQVPDWDFCFRPENDCSGLTELPTAVITYSYNQDYIGMSKDSDVLYKDRNQSVEMTYRYGLFDATTGADVTKSMSFGFPVRYTDSATAATGHGYYGAWQGRHQLWAGHEGSLATGTTVTREDVPPNQVAPTYTVKTYQGSLTKRGLAAASLAQIEDLPVEIWLSDHFDLRFDAALPGWKKCTWEKTGGTDEFGHEFWNESCDETAYDLSNLVLAENNHRKSIDAGREDCESYDPYPQNCTFHNYTYNGTTFVESEWSSSPGSTYGEADWADGDHLWVNIGGSTYITYTGIFDSGSTGWVEKTMTAFDEQTWTPSFDDEADVAFDFPRDREYYINNKGVNFVVRRIGSTDSADSYEVKMETQSVVRPDNLSSVFPSGTSYFAMEWEPEDSRSTFAFDSSSMLLKYRTVGSNAPSGTEEGSIATQGNWGLAAYDADGNRIENGGAAVQFNWEYATDSNPWGAITYLVKADGTIQYLDDPIMLDPIELTTLGGDTLTFSLQYDGWMHGLPDMHWELEKNDFQVSDKIKNKVVNIPAGTEVTESGSGASYVVKPLEVGVILPTVTEDEIAGTSGTLPDLNQSDSLSLDDLPTFTGNGVGSTPSNVTLKYIEGKAIVAKQ